MAITAIYTVSDTKRVTHIHIRDSNGVDIAEFVVPFTTRANLRSKLLALITELQTEFTRIRGEV